MAASIAGGSGEALREHPLGSDVKAHLPIRGYGSRHGRGG